MFGNGQLLQVDFIRPSSTTNIVATMLIKDRCIHKFVFIRKAFNPGMGNMWWTRVVWNQLEGVDYSQTLSSYLLSVVPHHLVGPPGKSRNFQHTKQYKIDVYINLYSSGKLLTLGWETNHIVVIAGVLEIPWFPGWPNQVVRHHT